MKRNTSEKKVITFFSSEKDTESDSLKSHQKVEVKEVPGLTVLPNYISQAEEKKLWNDLDALPWVVDFTRKLQYYGYRNEREKPYSLVPIPNEIPSCLKFLMNKILEDKLMEVEPDQVIINDYMPGEGIRPHFDRKDYFGEIIVGVSLGSDCVMEFASPQNEKVYIHIPKRSCYVLEGPARYKWKHSIPSRKTDRLGDGKAVVRSRRISITFRNVIQDQVKRV